MRARSMTRWPSTATRCWRRRKCLGRRNPSSKKLLTTEDTEGHGGLQEEVSEVGRETYAGRLRAEAGRHGDHPLQHGPGGECLGRLNPSSKKLLTTEDTGGHGGLQEEVSEIRRETCAGGYARSGMTR